MDKENTYLYALAGPNQQTPHDYVGETQRGEKFHMLLLTDPSARTDSWKTITGVEKAADV